MNELRRLADMHVHFRHDNDVMMAAVVKYTAKVCQYAVVMPNTTPPTITPEDVVLGRAKIKKVANRDDFIPLMMMKMESNCTPDLIRQNKTVGTVGTKSYPEGVTTNSSIGLNQEILNNPPKNLLDCWEEQQSNGMISSWHGEMPNSFVMDAELDFLKFIKNLALQFPKLKIVLEHITTAAAVELILSNQYKNIAATITYHHLRLTLDDVLKHSLRPHNYCKPVAKTPKDREALLNAAFSGHPNFFLGSDSAPHYKEKKLCDHGCAGVFTAPVLVQGLLNLFEEQDKLDKLENFACVYGPEFYGLEPSIFSIPVFKAPAEVDRFVLKEIDGIVPFHAGEKLKWHIGATV